MSETLAFWQETSQEVHRDRRREMRVPLVFPINVSGLDDTGHFFSENSTTHNISEQGCRFHLKNRPRKGDAVAIRMLSRNQLGQTDTRALLFEIRWVRPEGDGWLVGTYCLQPRNLWNMTFPEIQ